MLHRAANSSGTGIASSRSVLAIRHAAHWAEPELVRPDRLHQVDPRRRAHGRGLIDLMAAVASGALWGCQLAALRPPNTTNVIKKTHDKVRTSTMIQRVCISVSRPTAAA